MTVLSTEVFIPREVSIWYKRALFDDMICVMSSDDVVDLLHRTLTDEQLDYKEFFWVVLLNSANRVLGISRIAEGDSKSVFVSKREIVQLAILSHAEGVILAHNHPSGNFKPSKSDRLITSQLCKTMSLFDITLLDHIIFTSESHLSMADEGLLPY